MSTVLLVSDLPEYTLKIETYHGWSVFVHCEVHQWSFKTRRMLIEDLDSLQKGNLIELWAALKPEETQRIRFAKLFGFEESNYLRSPANGELYQILERR